MSEYNTDGFFVCPDNQRYIAEITDGHVIMNSKYLRNIFILCGIKIPRDLRAEYDGADYIYLEDKHFDKAFIEIYYTQRLKENGYTFVPKEKKV